MPWRDLDPRPYLLRRDLEPERTSPLPTNETCFMRRQHRCDKVFGASKSCFVACPTDETLGPLLALIEAKLAAHGIEAIVAVKERAYGQEIVCTKICGRIIESRFCVVILDEVARDGISVPNPNVYYEYGLMTALRKHVIPLQRDGMALAFNIQSHDTIRYNSRNMAEELERALRDAISMTEPGQERNEGDTPISARSLRRRLELAGFAAADRSVTANEATSDTQFLMLTSERGDYLFLAKIDNEKDVDQYLDDLPVLVYRLQGLRQRTQEELIGLPARIDDLKRALELARNQRPTTRLFDMERELSGAESRGPTLERRLQKLQSAHVGFVAAPDVDATQLLIATERVLTGTPMRAAWNEGVALRLGDTCLQLDRGFIALGEASSAPVED